MIVSVYKFLGSNVIEETHRVVPYDMLTTRTAILPDLAYVYEPLAVHSVAVTMLSRD